MELAIMNDIQNDHRLKWVLSEDDQKLERRKELQNKALDRFQDLGLLTRVVKNDEEILIINNVSFFKKGVGEIKLPDGSNKTVQLNDLLEDEAKTIMNSIDLGKGKKDRTLFYIFQDKKGVLNDEDLSMARDLIYIPDTVEDAFSPQRILEKSDKYVFLFSDFGTWGSTCPTKDRLFQSNLSNFEVSTAMMAWGIGKGRREDDDSFSVIRDVKSGDESRQKVTGLWFVKNFGVRKVETKWSWDSPKSLIEKFGDEHLIPLNLLKPTDFEDRYSFRSSNEVELGMKRPTKKGMVMIEGSRYCVGKEFSERNIRVLKLNKTKAIIVKKDSTGYELLKTFDIAPIDSQKTKIWISDGRKYLDVGKKNIKFNELEGTESVEINELKEFLDISRTCFERTGVDITDLSLRERKMSLLIFDSLKDKGEFWKFLKEYKKPWLQSLMIVDNLVKDQNGVLELSKRRDARPLFEKFGKIIELVSRYEEDVVQTQSSLKLDASQELSRMILANATLLFEAGVKVGDGNGNLTLYDVTKALDQFGTRIDKMFRKSYSLNIPDPEYSSMLQALEQNTDPNIRAVILAEVTQKWLNEAGGEKYQEIIDVLKETLVFYDNNLDLLKTASDTTGDKEKQQQIMENFIQQVSGIVLEVGCGLDGRLTIPMANKLQDKGSIIGMDILKPVLKVKPNNLDYIVGDMQNIPIANQSVDAVVALWSPWDDLVSRSMQLNAFRSGAEKLKVGGKWLGEFPYLEGGEGSWQQAADEFHKKHPDKPYGTIYAEFPNDKAKHFYIYPQLELKAMLEVNGLKVTNIEVYRTSNGKPRMAVTAEKISNLTPAMIS